MAETQAPEVKEEVKTTKISLKYELTNVGGPDMFTKGPNVKYDHLAGVWRLGPGTVEIDDATGDDLLRREAEYDALERDRLTSKEVIVDTGAVFSGAGHDVPTV